MRALKIMVIVRMAATGEDEYIEIKQTGDKSFNITLVGRDKRLRKETPYSGVAVATIIKSLSEKLLR